jgi:sec-independent protein translocase protein TatB
MRRMRGGWNSVRAEVERELQVAEIRQAARNASEHLASAQAGLNTTLGQLREPLDTRALNTLMPSLPSLDSAPQDSSGQIPPRPASTAAASSEPSWHGNTTEHVVHDVA